MEYLERPGRQVKMESPEVQECPECLELVKFIPHHWFLIAIIDYHIVIIYIWSPKGIAKNLYQLLLEIDQKIHLATWRCRIYSLMRSFSFDKIIKI
jgi:hypothetical protein